MEAWRQYRAFTLDQQPTSTRPLPVELAAIPTSPATSSTTLHGSITQQAKHEKLLSRVDNPSPPPTPLDPVPPPLSSSKPAPTFDHPPPAHAQGPDPSLSPIYVQFHPDDPSNPQNWTVPYKSWVIFLLTFLTLSLTFASSASSSAEPGVIQEFGCSEVAATATTGAFLVGMGMGAMPAAPLSELYGRLPVYVVTVGLAAVFQLAAAVAPNITALIVLRFIAGLLSSAPLSNAGGTLNDIGNPIVRTLALPLFTTCGFVSPSISPLIGGFLATSNLGWRWCYYLCAIWNAGAFVIVAVFMPETLAPALLKLKAMRLRKLTGDGRWRARVEDESLVQATGRALKRPFVMLAVEPVVQFFVAYITIVYIVLYGSFSAYPIIFAAHGLSPRLIGLTFLPITLGFILLLLGTYLHYLRYRRLYHDAKAGKQGRGIWGGKVEPEERLVPLMAAAIFFPAGLFWLAWTSPAKFSVWLTMMSGLPFAIGLLAIFQGSMQYQIDVYGEFASSALAGSTLVRYGLSGIVILGFPAIYENLGTQWATSLFAFLGLALTPVPFIFYHYGRRVRARCRFTVRD